MPGANSRTTGSATRWNSLTPSFMRQGSDQPFSVATGLNGRPVDGARGGCMVGEVWIAASGSDAAPTRLTAVAPRTAPAALKKVLRFVMVCFQCAAPSPAAGVGDEGRNDVPASGDAP